MRTLGSETLICAKEGVRARSPVNISPGTVDRARVVAISMSTRLDSGTVSATGLSTSFGCPPQAASTTSTRHGRSRRICPAVDALHKQVIPISILTSMRNQAFRMKTVAINATDSYAVRVLSRTDVPETRLFGAVGIIPTHARLRRCPSNRCRRRACYEADGSSRRNRTTRRPITARVDDDDAAHDGRATDYGSAATANGRTSSGSAASHPTTGFGLGRSEHWCGHHRQ
ncbi:hypothetical protein CES85_5443 [Ochrobactrum quorumnocens]|uniref:Uncharacterized protein n=1 Tax=Ochrobactrum quorumnocens TaxID=271865 RepID=A0A248UD76_9HYPH|nr:hypothetical protein CES85_5443 [[Ochrobactrum] quorumnocens]